MKIESYTLQVDNVNADAWAISTDFLTPENPSFKVKILSVDFMEIGLKSVNHEFIYYNNNGWLHGFENDGNGHSFQICDIIEVGIYFCQSNNDNRVYFTHNGQTIAEATIKNYSFYSTLHMGGFFNKIEYSLSNEV